METKEDVFLNLLDSYVKCLNENLNYDHTYDNEINIIFETYTQRWRDAKII